MSEPRAPKPRPKTASEPKTGPEPKAEPKAEPEIRYEDHGTKARFVIDLPEGEAELVLSLATPSLVIAEHSEVPKALEGRGLASKMVARLVTDAEAKGFRIVPLCPYVRAQFRRHPEWAPLFAW